MNNQLTIDELRAYQAGQLDGPARHRVERLLLEDPFYADALEGLEALQRTGASLPKQTAQLRRALQERINESATERRLFPLWVTTMAASIILVMGVALYLILGENADRQPVAQQAKSVESEGVPVQMGTGDSAIHKTVETVAVLEKHAIRQRTVHKQEAQPTALPVQPQASFVITPRNFHQTPITASKPLSPVQTQPEEILAEAESLISQSDEGKANPRWISHPERAFGPNPPEAPDMTFLSDNRTQLARTQTTMAAMQPDTKKQATDGVQLQEVRVVGYGTQQKQALTGAVATIPPGQSSPSPGQTKSSKLLAGIITDQQGAPLSGVSVLIKGTNQGANTNAAGQFVLDSLLVANRFLQIGHVGYQSQEVNALTLLAKNPIRLVEDTRMLSEVVTVGYGRTKAAKTQGTATRSGSSSFFVTELSPSEIQDFQAYVNQQAAPSFQGPLSVKIQTKADGSVRQVSVEDGILIRETDGREHREYKPSPATRAEAERLVRSYGNWPKKRQTLHWITGWLSK